MWDRAEHCAIVEVLGNDRIQGKFIKGSHIVYTFY